MKINILVPQDLSEPTNNKWRSVAVEKKGLIQLLQNKKVKEYKTKTDRIFPTGNDKKIKRGV